MKKSTIAISIGDPCGIGPEVTLRALKVLRENRWDAANLVVYGDREVLDVVVRRHIVPPGAATRVSLVDLKSFKGPPRARACREGGRAALEYLDAAIADAVSGKIDAVVTAPLSKEAARASHHDFTGQTEYLGRAFGVKGPVMMMLGGGLRVALVTTHCALKDVPRLVTVETVLHTILTFDRALRQYFRIRRPRIVTCGLNPHPAEDAPWTRSDRETVAPAVRLAGRHGVECAGPVAGDTAFHRALSGEFDAVVAMYHDQGLAPLKTLAFETAVNVTLGLPIVRTSPGHGTAFDVAGTGRADPGAMVEAVKCAARMLEAGRRNRTGARRFARKGGNAVSSIKKGRK
ncbi:MAG: 4-hydroxythreonine-4-phosphate dehydrogenase PdxA [Planctomycetota bacterium]|nr:MAG: 4-hydroxythreonine-4-phosphate dehydrogenase PdxA [Planctomycetota bacterium]